ncbi:MAG: 6-phosphogluconolactonase [Sphaerochaetaceae bacterium]
MKKFKVNAPKEAVAVVKGHIEEVATNKEGPIHIALPGGRGATVVVEGLVSLDQQTLSRVVLYLVDERLTGATNRDTLMDVGLKEAIEQGRFREEQLHLPQLNTPFMAAGTQLDLVYLGVGEDGHIASLFPRAYPELDSKETSDIVYIADSPKPPPERLSLSYRGFKRYAKKSSIYLLFFGEGKRIAYERFLAGEENPATLPCLFFPREWFNTSIITDLQES